MRPSVFPTTALDPSTSTYALEDPLYALKQGWANSGPPQRLSRGSIHENLPKSRIPSLLILTANVSA